MREFQHIDHWVIIQYSGSVSSLVFNKELQFGLSYDMDSGSECGKVVIFHVEKLEKKVGDIYFRRSLSQWQDGEYATCDSIGINGGCGTTCPLFQDGKCTTPEEIIDHMKEVISYYEEDKDE